MRNVALSIHLRLLTLGRRGERNDPKNTRAHPIGHGLDRAALACPVPSFEDDADLQPLVHYPVLELHELDMQPRELPLVILPLQLALRGNVTPFLVRHRVTRQSVLGIREVRRDRSSASR